MRLITWNVNSIRARLPRVRELLDTHRPDVVCVQETKVADGTFPHAALAEHGYRAVAASEGRWNGVALLVPEGVSTDEVVTQLPGAPDPTEARWVEAVVDGVRVASVYVPNGRDRDHPMFASKLRFLEAMHDHLDGVAGRAAASAETEATTGTARSAGNRASTGTARSAGTAASAPMVVAGDVNIAPEDRDVWDVAQAGLTTHITEEERERLAALLALGFVDAFRAVEPEEEGFTWWDYRMGAFRRGWGMRIDLAMVGAGLTVTGCGVDTTFRRVNAAGDKPSDHAPLIVDLERTAG